MPDPVGLLIFVFVSLLTATVGLVLTAIVLPAGRNAPRLRASHGVTDVIRRYVFRDGYLLSEVDPNDAFLDPDTDRSEALELLAQALASLHPDIPQSLSALRNRGEAFVLVGRLGDDPFSVAGRKEDDRLILSVGPTDANGQRHSIEATSLKALQTEVSDLRRALDQGALAVWKETADGQVLWANAGYFALAGLVAQEPGTATGPMGWPIPRIFDPATVAEDGPDRAWRAQLTLDTPDGTARHWYEVTRKPGEDGMVTCVAQLVDKLVAAETTLREFVQTLSKTFAQLPIGLAVFDRTRNLVLFNPALLTLSTLGAEFLSSRPSLAQFLDQLRDRQRMPEPKDYRSWRDEITRLETGAEDGSYHEIWTLPCGQSLRVIGRPHPDGAVAFMFEDISAEVTLTREFRGDLDILKSALDAVPHPLAVFGADGQAIFRNVEYGRLTANTLPKADLQAALDYWHGADPASDPSRGHGNEDAASVPTTALSALCGGAMLLRVMPPGAEAVAALVAAGTSEALPLTVPSGVPDARPSQRRA